MANISRIVHLDLKGAAPRISYLQKIIPLLSKWGAAGLLIEYEDMFPYQWELSEIRRSSAYSIQQIKEITFLAQQNNLEVIPLVQTFGHFEIMEGPFEGFHEATEGTTNKSYNKANCRIVLVDLDSHNKCVIHRSCISRSSLSYAPDGGINMPEPNYGPTRSIYRKDVRPYKSMEEDVPENYQTPLRSAQDIKDSLKKRVLSESNTRPPSNLQVTWRSLKNFSRFVLKHDRFRHFREMDLYPNALCPEHPNAAEFVLSLIKQVIDLHPYSKQIHIGSDEVWHLGKCEQCIKKMEIHNWRTIELYLNWVAKIATLVKKNYPAINIIIWDDMIRNCTSQTLEAFEMGFLVEPMIWKYDADTFDLPLGMFDIYAKVFCHVWVASCFKGATGSSQSIVPIQHHINNHLTWITTLKKYMSNFKEIKGIALTGWQRYDHYAVMCEMLPVALPCLALCLCVLTRESFLESDHDKVSQELGFLNRVNVHPFPRPQIIEQGMTFPGHELYVAVQIWSNVVCRYQFLCNSEGMLGWFNDYLQLKNCTSPAQVENILFPMVEVYDNMMELQKKFEKHLVEIFYEDTVEEWLGCFIYPLIKKVDNIIKGCKEQLRLATTQIDMELQSPLHMSKIN